ncbi:nuclear transport factor 2 family protein [Pseudonocardia nematodicida]|uniref:Nuclear transport factor 2 family protein n=1 Tax=Pseudonocardia nematodicida TaxID=1206997 RepID=A0ABV1KAB1_9PSEU
MLEAADTDIARFFSLFADDCVFRLGNNEIVRGRHDIQEWVGGFLGGVTGLRHTVLEMWFEGEVTAVHADVTYTLHDGTSLTLPVVTRTRIREGQAHEYLIFMDPGPVVAASS